MSYIDAFLDRKNDKVRVAERDSKGRKTLREFPAPYVFYYEHASGTTRSIFGHPVKRVSHNSSHKFRAALNEHAESGDRIFESDINPVFRCLASNYAGQEAPTLNIGFFDIEADFDDHNGKYDSGWADPTDPHNKITAITLYRSHDKRLLTYVLRPPTVTHDAAQAIADKTEDTFLFDDEKAMLEAFLDAIENIDVLTSWNGSAYDVPYTVNRVARVLGKDEARRFCLWDQMPSEREYKNKFGKMVTTFDFVGRVHLDYLELYAKHNPQQRLSYALNAIGQLEVKESKTQYEGTLDDLYKKEFEKFIEYNRQDVMLMVKIDAKLKYIELHNQVAHSNSVILKTTMGSVALVEQAIINEMHMDDLVAPNRKSKADIEFVLDADDSDDDDEIEDGDEHWQKIIEDEGRTPVVGAYVAHPKVGLHEHVGCVDVTSLYPSVIRALNMSPETLVGQVRPDETMRVVQERAAKLSKTKKAEAWDGLFCTLEVSHVHDRTDDVLTIDLFDLVNEKTTTKQMTGKELYDYVFDPKNNVCITANGTIFRTNKDGIIPRLLARWFKERKEMQGKEKEWKKKLKEADTDEAKTEAKLWADYWGQRQQARKILLNSLYGALLNEALRFYDERLGQSVTLSGRSVVRHMNATINELVTGSYDYRGDAIVYADTDSCYFSAYEVLRNDPQYEGFDWSRENIIVMYDLISDEMNKTFPDFMRRTFNTSMERGAIIKAGRELVASKALFIKKKKYAVLMYDKEGDRLDADGPGKLKVMGLDLKRADTPRYMQEFLENLLMNLLTDKPKETIYENIKAFRKMFKTRPGWEKGSPKKVSNLGKYAAMRKETDVTVGALSNSRPKASRKPEKKATVPGHVRASLNWNKLRDIYHDKHAVAITDSARIIVCKLTSNTMDISSIAYPIDEPHLPEWFKELPFDHLAMEEVIIDNKILNIVGVLNWNLTDTKEKAAEDMFTW